MPNILNPNTSPSLITFKRTITLSTVDQNNNNAAISEAYSISGPSSQGITPILIANGTKAVIPLSTTTGNGAPYLKIHFPTAANPNKIYITYAVANQYMADGFYDYKTGVPTAYMTALRNWINTNPSTGQVYGTSLPTTRTRSLKFICYGTSTNKPANSVTLYVRFQGLFGAIASAPSGTLITSL
jgi:hypothetical protein